MPGEESKLLQKSISKVARAGRIASYVFGFFSIGCAFLGISFTLLCLIALIMPDTEVISSSLEGSVSGIFLLLFSYGLACLSLWVMCKISKDMANKSSPFTRQNAKALKILGALFIFRAAIDAYFSVGVPPEVATSNLYFAYTPNDQGLLHVDVQMLIVASACFLLSFIFEHGRLLQKLTDDTV